MEHEPPPKDSEPVVLTPLVAPRRGGLRLQDLMFVVVGCALLIWLGMLARYWLILGLILGGGALAVLLAVLVGRRNASQQESLLWALAIASDRSMPLTPAALAFAEQFGASYRWKVRLLAALLEEGKTLPEAIRTVPGLFNREASVMIRTGWATGTLPGALRRAALEREAGRGEWGDVSSRLSYVVTVLLSLELATAYLMYFKAPQLRAIFGDFGIALPRVTVFTIEVATSLAGPWGLVAVAAVLLQIFALMALLLGRFNLFQMDIPLLDSLFRRRHSSLILRSLALGIEGGKPIPGVLSALTDEYPSAWVRRRLRAALTQVNQGGDWVRALLGRGLIRPADAALLLSAQRVGNLAWALNEASASADRRAGYRLRVLTEALFPVVVAMLGLFVFVFAVAYFYPLVTLIEVLAR